MSLQKLTVPSKSSRVLKGSLSGFLKGNSLGGVERFA